MANPAMTCDETSIRPLTDVNPSGTNPVSETSDAVQFTSNRTGSGVLSFDFRQDKWPEFKARLTQYLTDCHITSSNNKREKLINAFDEHMYTLVKNMCINNPTDTDYDELIGTLDRYFEPVDNVYTQRDIFYKAHRLPNEPVTEWANRLKSLALSCKFDHDWSNVMGDIFVTGMGDDPIKEYIMQKKNIQNTADGRKSSSYFSTLLDAALDKEAVLNGLKSRTQISSKPTICRKTMSGKDDFYYKLNKNQLGLAVIFNHENFLSKDLEHRDGTRMDEINLFLTLSKLGFEVRTFNDLRQHQIFEWTKHYSSLDHSKYSCFVMFILTHGQDGHLCSMDNRYRYKDIVSRFTADCCETLAGKPKLFFIQACRGDILDSGYTFTQTDCCESESYKIPIFADILIAHSTVPGFKSFRDGVEGTFFIKALCDVLNENAHKHSLLTLLTMVNRKVALDYKSYNPDKPRLHEKKQMPCVESMLTRVFKFPENSNEE